MNVIEPLVIFEDNHLIAINKPSGWLVQGDQTGDQTLLDWAKEYIKLRYQKPGDVFLGVVHRLDRPVSGVVLFARTSKALVRMNEMFAERKIDKSYLALVAEQPDPLDGHLEHLLVKDEAKNQSKAFDIGTKRAGASAKLAVLDYKLLAAINDKHLLGITPHTGRPHQIRAQLAKFGCPIYNDVKYGGAKLGGDKGAIYLHSRVLGFEHPVTKVHVEIRGEPNYHDDNWRLFRQFC